MSSREEQETAVPVPGCCCSRMAMTESVAHVAETRGMAAVPAIADFWRWTASLEAAASKRYRVDWGLHHSRDVDLAFSMAGLSLEEEFNFHILLWSSKACCNISLVVSCLSFHLIWLSYFKHMPKVTRPSLKLGNWNMWSILSIVD